MRRPCLIAYDIANPRRLVRLHRGLKRFAFSIQYSVFHGEFSEPVLAEVVQLIERVIDPKQDDVRIYLLPREGWARALGRPGLPEGVFCTDLPLPFRSGLKTESDSPPVNVLPGSAPPPAMKRRSPLPRKESGIARSIRSRVKTGHCRGISLL